MLVEAAWPAGKAPGPLRSFFLRIRDRRGFKRSGYGWDLSMYGFNDYTRIKHVLAPAACYATRFQQQE